MRVGRDTFPYVPVGLYPLKMISNDVVKVLKVDDLLMIDTSIRIYKEGLVVAFEYRGYVFVRRFGIAPFGYKNIKDKKVYFSMDCKDDYFAYDELNVIGIVVAKQNVLS